jgi:hypothetical protein
MEPDKKYYVYVLCWPGHEKVYVGHSCNPESRLAHHRHTVTCEERSPTTSALKQALKSLGVPMMLLIDGPLDRSDAGEHESYWISTLKSDIDSGGGYNSTFGRGRSFNEHSGERLTQSARLAKSVQTKELTAKEPWRVEAALAVNNSPAGRQAIASGVRNMSPEARANISAAARNKSPEARANISAAARKPKDPASVEKARAALKEYYKTHKCGMHAKKEQQDAR